MDTSDYDEVEDATVIHVGVELGHEVPRRVLDEQRVTFAVLRDSIIGELATLTDARVRVHVKDRVLRKLWRTSCLKALSPVPKSRNFNPSALMGHLGGCRAVVLLLAALGEGDTRTQHCALALHLAWNLSAYAENKVRFVLEGVVPVLCRILEASGWGAEPEIARSASAVLQNISERRFRRGETNPMQLRVAAEGGLEALVRLSARASARGHGARVPDGMQVEVGEGAVGGGPGDVPLRIVSLMGACNLSLHRGNAAAFEASGARDLLRRIVSSRVLLDAAATGDAFDGWLSLIPMVPLLTSPYEEVRAFAVQCLSRAAQDEAYLHKLWRDFALVDGLGPLRDAARRGEVTPALGEGLGGGGADVFAVPETAGEHAVLSQWRAQAGADEVGLMLREGSGHAWDDRCTGRLAQYILDRMNAAPVMFTIPPPPDTLARDLGRLVGVRMEEQEARVAPAEAHVTCGMFADVTFVVGGGGEEGGVDELAGSVPGPVSFAAHRVILASRLPSFLILFTSSFGDAAASCVTLPDVHPVGFRALLEWAYTGGVRGGSGHTLHSAGPSSQPLHSASGVSILDPAVLLHGLAVADRFDAPAMRVILEEAAAQGVEEDNAEDVLAIARSCGARDLASHCTAVLRRAKAAGLAAQRRRAANEAAQAAALGRLAATPPLMAGAQARIQALRARLHGVAVEDREQYLRMMDLLDGAAARGEGEEWGHLLEAVEEMLLGAGGAGVPPGDLAGQAELGDGEEEV